MSGTSLKLPPSREESPTFHGRGNPPVPNLVVCVVVVLRWCCTGVTAATREKHTATIPQLHRVVAEEAKTISDQKAQVAMNTPRLGRQKITEERQ